MIDGVAVEKHEARQVYEEVVRQGIDPGLVQWTAGNNFQTRVFPIPGQRHPHGPRPVRHRADRRPRSPAYHLPLKFKGKIGQFSLRVEVVKAAAPPQVSKGELTNFAFQQWRDSYVAETKQQNWTSVEDLVIALPKTDGPQVLVEKADDGQTYFAIQDYPQQVAGDQITAIPNEADGGLLGRLRLAGRRPQAGNRRPAGDTWRISPTNLWKRPQMTSIWSCFAMRLSKPFASCFPPTLSI